MIFMLIFSPLRVILIRPYNRRAFVAAKEYIVGFVEYLSQSRRSW